MFGSSLLFVVEEDWLIRGTLEGFLGEFKAAGTDSIAIQISKFMGALCAREKNSHVPDMGF